MLFKYIEEGNLEEIKNIVKINSNLHLFDINGDTPLFLACCKSDLETIKYLIASGANCNQTNNNALGFSALHGAVINDQFENVKYLLSKNINTELTDKYGNTPLYLAATHAQLEISRLLINAGANLNAVNNSGNNIVHTICLYAKETSEKIEIGQNIIEEGNTLYEKYFDTLNLLLTNGASSKTPNIDEFSPMHLAAIADNQDFMQILEMHGADINISTSTGYAPIHAACRNNSMNAVKYLIKRKANLNIQDEYGITALHEACDEGNFEIVKMLIEAGADKSLTVVKVYDDVSSGFTALDIAKVRNYKSIISFLET